MPGKPEFGCNISEKLFELFGESDKFILKDMIEEALRKYEPRILVSSVNVELMPEYNRIVIDINFIYQFIGKNVEGNTSIVLSDS